MADNIDSAATQVVDPNSMDVDQLMGYEPSTFQRVLSSPWLQLGLPLAAGVASGFERGVGPGVRTGVQAAQGLSGIALGQQKAEAQDTARRQRVQTARDMLKNFPTNLSDTQKSVLRAQLGTFISSGQMSPDISALGQTQLAPHDTHLGTHIQRDWLDKQGRVTKTENLPIDQPTVQIPATLQKHLAQGDFDSAIADLSRITDSKQYEFASRQIDTAMNRAGLRAQHENDKAQQERLSQQGLDLRREIAQGNQSLRREMMQGREAQMGSQPFKGRGGTVIDAQTGQPVQITEGEYRQNPSRYVGLTVEQTRKFEGFNSFDTHINLTSEFLGILRKKGVKLTDNVYAQLQRFQNDPDFVALIDTLDPQTALAIGGSIAGSSSGGGRGRWLFEAMSKAGVNENDNLQTAIKKLQTFAEINASNARKSLPQGATKAYDETLRKFKAMSGNQGAQLSPQQINQLKAQLQPGEVLAIGPNGERKAILAREVAEFSKRGFQIIR